MDKVGVFLCTGCEIGASLKTDALEGLSKKNGAVQYATHPCLCEPAGVAALRGAVEGGAVDALVIAACSARHKQQEFRFDPTKVAVERVSLREQVAWTHPAGHEDTQMLAEDMLQMGIVKAKKMSLAKRLEEAIDQTVLVVGGGLAGLEAAKTASGLGHPVVIVEKTAKLGGYLAGVREVTPDVAPYDRLRPSPVVELEREVRADRKIRVLTGSRLLSVSGQPGQFAVEVDGTQGRE